MEQRLLSALTRNVTGSRDKSLLPKPLRFEFPLLQQLTIITLTNATAY